MGNRRSKTPAERITERVSFRGLSTALVARIHTQTPRGWAKRGAGATAADLLPPPVIAPDDSPQEVAHMQAQEAMREAALAALGDEPLHPLRSLTEAGQPLRTYSPTCWGGWLHLEPGEALPVGPLPAELESLLAQSFTDYRQRVVDFYAPRRITPNKRPGDAMPPLAQILGALLPSPSSLAVSIGRPEEIIDQQIVRRFRAARLMADFSIQQLGALLGIDPKQVSDHEQRKEALSDKHLPLAAWALFPDLDAPADGKRLEAVRVTEYDSLSLPQQRACDWLLWGGSPWWWATPDALAIPGQIGAYALPRWSAAILPAFTAWLWKTMRSPQRRLVAAYQAVPEIGTDGQVALRRFTAYAVQPVLRVRGVDLQNGNTASH